MMKYLTIVMSTVFLLSVMAGAGDKQGLNVVKQVAQESVLESRYQLPEGIIGPLRAMDPSLGDTIGYSDYDYGWNSGSRKMVESYFPGVNNGTRAQFTYMFRNTSVSATRIQTYVYYNGSTYATGSVTPGQSGFGDISVFRSGGGDGHAVVSFHTPRRIAINDQPGGLNFTDFGIPNPRPVANSLDPITGVRGEDIYALGSGDNRTDIWAWKTSDFGVNWIFLDSLSHRGPFPSTSFTLDPPFVIRANGDLYVFSDIVGDGALPPLGAGTPGGCDRIGYFRSTNGGTNWTFTTVARDGEALLPSAPTEFFLPENFGQLDGVVDANGAIHVVFNGYAIDTVATEPYPTYRAMYWNSSSGTFRNISRDADVHSQWNAPARRSGNALGRCYPTIAYDPTSNLIFTAWSEPQIDGANVDTSSAPDFPGAWYYDVWYNYSRDGGATWAGPTRLTNSQNVSELFTTVDQWLTSHPTDPNKRRAHLVYEADTRNGMSVFTTCTPCRVGLEAWVYHTIDVDVTTSVNEIEGLPTAYVLRQNYPNPFNPSTTIKFGIPREEFVTLKVYNMLGQEVKTLVNDVRQIGTYEVTFDAADLPSGVYFYKLSAGNYLNTKKMLLLK
jgi:hypothetical protein